MRSFSSVLAALGSLILPAAAATDFDAIYDAPDPLVAAKAFVEANKWPALPDGYSLAYGFCSDDNRQCHMNQAMVTNAVPEAYAGDYQAQRNLSFCLYSGCDGAVFEERALSCAWRIVIAASGRVPISGVA